MPSVKKKKTTIIAFNFNDSYLKNCILVLLEWFQTL